MHEKLNPRKELEKGVQLLDPVMQASGFRFKYGEEGKSSGGYYSTGYYEKENRRLSLSVRYSLGEVSYEFGSEKISHVDYLRALDANGEYPGYSTEVIEVFCHLRNDVKNFFTVFLSGTDEELREIFKYVQQNPKKHGFGALLQTKNCEE